MSPGFLFVTLLGSTFTVYGQTLPLGQSSITPSSSNLIPEDLLTSITDPVPGNDVINPTPLDIQSADAQSAVKDAKATEGNIQVMHNDQLWDIMKKLDITREEIRAMLDLSTEGGSPTITKASRNSRTGLPEMITLDFERFVATPPSGDDNGTPSKTSVPPIVDQPPIQPTSVVKPVDGPSDTSPPRTNTLANLQDAAEYIRGQLRELDSQLLALDDAYRFGQITRLRRNQNVLENRERHHQLESDLRTIQREIFRLMIPQAQRTRPREIFLGSEPELPINPQNTDLRQLQRDNQILEQRMRQIRDDPRLTATSTSLGVEEPLLQLAIVLHPPESASLSYEDLRQELIRIRLWERYIDRRLQMLSAINSRFLGRGRMPTPGNGIFERRPFQRRMHFSNLPQLSLHRTLSESIAGRNAPKSPIRIL